MSLRIINPRHHRGRRHVLNAFDRMSCTIRLHAQQFNRRIELTQAPRCAHKGAAGAQRCHKMRNLSAGLLPNLGTRRLVVGLHVGRIVVLIRIKVALGMLRDNCTDRPNGQIHALGSVGEQYLSAERAQDAFALRTRIPRQRHSHAIAQRRAECRIRDAGVATGSVRDTHPWS